MAKRIVLGIYVKNRTDISTKLQGLMTKYGCCIKMRLGLHETNEKACSPDGLQLLEVLDNAEAKKFIRELKLIKNLSVKSIEFKVR
jgi:hypothetical protein